MNGFGGEFCQIVLEFLGIFLDLRGLYFLVFQQMFINVHLLRDIDHLFGDIFIVIKYIFVLSVEFEAFILEVIAFFNDGFELLCDGIVDELVLNIFLELMEEFGQLKYFYLVCLDELLLMLEDGLLECLVHG